MTNKIRKPNPIEEMIKYHRLKDIIKNLKTLEKQRIEYYIKHRDKQSKLEIEKEQLEKELELK